MKTPSKNPLTPWDITILTRQLLEQHRMDLFRFRADIKWGKNKERVSLFILSVSLVLGSYLRHIWKSDKWLKETFHHPWKFWMR